MYKPRWTYPIVGDSSPDSSFINVDLPAPLRTEHRHPFTGFDAETDSVQHTPRAVIGFEILRYVTATIARRLPRLGSVAARPHSSCACDYAGRNIQNTGIHQERAERSSGSARDTSPRRRCGSTTCSRYACCRSASRRAASADLAPRRSFSPRNSAAMSAAHIRRSAVRASGRRQPAWHARCRSAAARPPPARQQRDCGLFGDAWRSLQLGARFHQIQRQAAIVARTVSEIWSGRPPIRGRGRR